MTKITRTPRTGRSGAMDVDEKPEDRRYVALQTLRIGERWVSPGEELTAEDMRGRNVSQMLLHGQVQHALAPKQARSPRRPAARTNRRTGKS